MSLKSNTATQPSTWTDTVRVPAATAAAAPGVAARIVCHPAVLGGEAHIRGTRVTVRDVVHCLATHRSGERLWLQYPELDPDDVRAAVDYATLQPGARASGQS